MADGKKKQEMVAAILGMSYGELLQVSETLAGMVATGNGARPRPKSAADFASLLYDWADAEPTQRRR